MLILGFKRSMNFTILSSMRTSKDKWWILRRVSSMMSADKLSAFLSMWNPDGVDDLGTNFPKCLRNSRLIRLFFFPEI